MSNSFNGTVYISNKLIFTDCWRLFSHIFSWYSRGWTGASHPESESCVHQWSCSAADNAEVWLEEVSMGTNVRGNEVFRVIPSSSSQSAVANNNVSASLRDKTVTSSHHQEPS